MNLSAPLTSVSGIGPKTSAELAKYGFTSVRDLVYNLPRAYENYQAATNIADIRPGKVVIRGKISDLTTRRTRRRNFTITEAVIRDRTDAIRAVWFNQPYRTRAFQEGKEYYFSGEYALKNNRYQLTNPNAALATDVAPLAGGGFQPIYKSHGSLNSHFFARTMEKLRPAFADIPDLLPGLPAGTRRTALFYAHFPKNPREADRAHDALAYEELFEFSLAAELNKLENHQLKSPVCPFVAENTQKLTSALPFPLTGAQRRASWEILQDLAKSTPMNRLLQGDVGAGKTVVAAIAAAQAIAAGHQVALLAPTAILATQHAEGLAKILSPLGINIALLTSATKHKATLKKQLAEGNIDLIVGTHALFTTDTHFHSLGLVVIDEQHRFGVAQRQKLQEITGALAPHLLMMTATPIPRSLQLAIFGDLDVSILDELPKGRQPIATKILPEASQAPDLYPAIAKALARGEQVYWICPAIEDSETSEFTSVRRQAGKLQKIFQKAKIEFLHGKMKPADKDAIMAKFASGAVDILVSTTVVEVGVDVPNATQIVIMDAEHYGLAQLHQLRGRVGRGQKPSACYLIVAGENPPSRRLRELEKSTDGFHLAEVDLKLRGPGEIYGALQHGALDLRIATLDNQQLVVRASRDAKSFAAQISQNPKIMLQYKELATSIAKYQQLTTLN